MSGKEVESGKLEREAEAAGLVLIGAGKNCNYRTYRWQSCGHEAQCEPGKVRKGNVRCQVCFDQKIHDEASAAGLLWVGKGKSPNYRTYRWITCGHEAQYYPRKVRHHEVGCKQCLDIKLRDEAEASGLVLVGKGENCFYRKYRWQSCGHEAEYRTGSVRKANVRCQVCFNQNLHDEALSAGLYLIGPGRNSEYRTYRWQSCGHELEYRTDKVRMISIRCQQCLDIKLADEANSAGLLLIAMGRDKQYRTYRWKSCGHETEYNTFAVRIGSVCCQVCDATAWSKPSIIYLLHFAADDGTNWLKLGVAKNIDTRIRDYGLFDGVRLIECLATIPADTGKEATTVEKALHKKFRTHRIHPGQMKDFMSKSGHTECYPMSMRDKLLDAINALASNDADAGI